MTEWWRGGVFYQIYPRSFCDSNNDGVGDLKGITEKLDYVASLGIDGIWLSPFFKSPMADFGYDVADYRDVDPLFGTLDDFDEMLARAHDLGLKLIIDQVLSHSSNQHPWFVESRRDQTNPKADWYIWADPQTDGTPPNNWMSVFGGSAWTYETRRGQYYMHNFLSAQPDLNLHNPDVQEQLLNDMKFWLDRGVDGFRLDAINFYMHDPELRNNPPKENAVRGNDRHSHPYTWQHHIYDKSHPDNVPFLKRLRKLTDQYDARMMVAEIGDDKDIVARCAEYTDGPEMIHTVYNFSLLGDDYSAAHIRNTLETTFNQPADSWPSWSFSNHDIVRVASRWAQDGKTDTTQIKMLIALLCSLQGTIFMYQGEELGLSEADVPFEKLQDPYGIYLYPEDKGRDGCRTPMPWSDTAPHGGFSMAEPWLPIPKDHIANAVTIQEQNDQSPLHFTRRFLQWRKAHKALISGDITFLDAPEPLLAFTRETKDQTITALFNLGADEIRYTSEAPLTPLQGHGLPYQTEGDSVILPPYGGFLGQ